MTLTTLNQTELATLYRTRLQADFPPSERKPLRAMQALMDAGQYEPLLATQDGQSVGYAMIWRPPAGDGVLLEYFAVLPPLRSGGLGGQILELLTTRYGSLLVESEAPTGEDTRTDDLRRRRIAFYQRSGFRLLDYRCALFGVPFRCLYRGTQQDDRVVETLHRSVYAGWFSPAHMERFIQLPLQPGEAIRPAPEWLEEEHSHPSL